MPIIDKIFPQPNISLGIWDIREDEPFFTEKMTLSEAEAADCSQMKGMRRLEWLASRWLLHEMTGAEIRLPLAKTAFSKPFFPENDDLACSLSHSRGVVAVLLCDRVVPPFFCGCDLQKLEEKMFRIAHKFMRPEENSFLENFNGPQTRLEILHLFWTAKESLYKAWGTKSLDFRANLSIDPFEWNGTSGHATGHIRKGNTNLDFDISFFSFVLNKNEPFFLTYCLPKQV